MTNTTTPTQQPELLPAIEPAPDLATQLTELVTPLRATLDTKVQDIAAIGGRLPAMREQYQGVIYDVETTKGLDAAKKARQEIKAARVGLEHLRKDLKSPILELGRAVDAHAEKIKLELVALETPVDEQIKAEETRKAQAKAAAEERERLRRQAIQAAFDQLAGAHLAVANEAPGIIGLALDAVTAYQPNEADFGHRLEEGTQAHQAAIRKLQFAYDEAVSMALAKVHRERGQRIAAIRSDAFLICDTGTDADLAAALGKLASPELMGLDSETYGDQLDDAMAATRDAMTRLRNELQARTDRRQEAERQRQLLADQARQAERQQQIISIMNMPSSWAGLGTAALDIQQTAIQARLDAIPTYHDDPEEAQHHIQLANALQSALTLLRSLRATQAAAETAKAEADAARARAAELERQEQQRLDAEREARELAERIEVAHGEALLEDDERTARAAHAEAARTAAAAELERERAAAIESRAKLVEDGPGDCELVEIIVEQYPQVARADVINWLEKFDAEQARADFGL